MAKHKSSDRSINYNLRPAKSTERRIMLDFLKEICSPKESANYQYVGFGASFYSDFKLFHSELNIRTMISIEEDDSVDNRKRCEFNEPYKCIKTIFGKSCQVLPSLEWNKKSIVWLDYDKCLSPYMLEDIETCCHIAQPWNVLLITLRADGFSGYPTNEFDEEFGKYSPADLIQEGLEDSVAYKAIYHVLKAKLEETLSNQNSSLPEPEKLVFRQLFYFYYMDGAPMITFGGVFHSYSETIRFEEMHFNSNPHLNATNEILKLNTPIITNKEYHKLCQLLPSERDEFVNNPDIKFVPERHRKSFFENYRYYPKYVELKDM